jgi:hypothetical protein
MSNAVTGTDGTAAHCNRSPPSPPDHLERSDSCWWEAAPACERFRLR